MRRTRIAPWAASLVLALIMAAPGLANAQRTASFSHPQVGGAPADWCSTFATDCGQGGADLFCRSIGLPTASRWSNAPDPRTWVIGSGVYCDANSNRRCDSLRDVTCVDTAAQGPDRGPAPGPGPTASTPPPAASDVAERLSNLGARLSGEDYARLYADLSVLIARYGAQVGWLDLQDSSAPSNDPGRGVTDWNAHYNHARNFPGTVPGTVSGRMLTLRDALRAGPYAQLRSEVSAILARYGG